MSHFFTAVIVPERTLGLKRRVTKMLAPYDENGEWFRDGSRWDWWVIGGRWDGAITGVGPATVEVSCSLCHGSGTRKDWGKDTTPEWIAQCNGCNGCHGVGTRIEYPGQYGGELHSNVCRVANRDPEAQPFAIVTPDGAWHERFRMGLFAAPYDGEEPDHDWEARSAAIFAQYEVRHLVVGVDCHV